MLIKKFYASTCKNDFESFRCFVDDNYDKESYLNKRLSTQRELIKEAKNYSQNSETDFKIKDLFLTSYLSESKEMQNYLLDYPLHKEFKITDVDFFKETLALISDADVDSVKDDKTQRTILMRITCDSEVKPGLLSAVLNKQPDSMLDDKDGFNALELALMFDNKNVILALENYIADKELPPKTNMALNIYKGLEPMIQENDYSKQFMELLYRIANQVQNYAMVDQLYALLGMQERFEHLKTNQKLQDILSSASNYFYPPLWSYNICQLRDYAREVAKQMIDHLIQPEMLVHKEDKYYNLTLPSGETLTVLKKSNQVISRILGRNYLEQEIKKRNFKNLAVPRKFLLAPTHIDQINVRFKLPCSKSNGGENPIGIEFEGFELYAEFIEEDKLKTEELGQQVWPDVGSMGFRDFGAVGANLFVSKRDGKTYIIDTEGKKNFFSSYFFPNTANKAIEYIKEFHFDKRTEFISIKMSVADLSLV
ncbi:MAG: hypothetical protein ABFQ95_03820 [Pseudomonadota bacterium]